MTIEKRQRVLYRIVCDGCRASGGDAPSESEAREFAEEAGFEHFEYGYPTFSVMWFCAACLPAHQFNRELSRHLLKPPEAAP